MDLKYVFLPTGMPVWVTVWQTVTHTGIFNDISACTCRQRFYVHFNNSLFFVPKLMFFRIFSKVEAKTKVKRFSHLSGPINMVLVGMTWQTLTRWTVMLCCSICVRRFQDRTNQMATLTLCATVSIQTHQSSQLPRRRIPRLKLSINNGKLGIWIAAEVCTSHGSGMINATEESETKVNIN